MSDKAHYERVLADLVRKFGDTLRQREELNVELVEVFSALRALGRLLGEDPKRDQYLKDLAARMSNPLPPPGITGGVALVLQLEAAPMAPTQIRDRLVECGYDLRRYTFPMASVHNSLKRLMKSGLIRAVQQGDGSKLYVWNV